MFMSLRSPHPDPTCQPTEAPCRRQRRGCSLRSAILFGLIVLLLALQNRPESTLAAEPTDKPNIVYIMADDMGYGDPSCYNPASKCPTPNLDRLAREGMRFTDAHAPAGVCVPSRFGLLSGRFPYRMQKDKDGLCLPKDRLTVANLLQKAGYQTACIGKWHLGFTHEKEPGKLTLDGGPASRGFDTYFGIPASLDIPPYYYIEGKKAVEPPTDFIAASSSPNWSPIQGAFWREGKIAPGYRHREVLPKFIQRSLGYLEGRAKKPKQPFFLYIALPAPHTPWLPTEPFEGVSQAALYGDFVTQVDASIGQVLQKLDQLNLTENTIVMVSSDNGPCWYDVDEKKYQHYSAGPLRGMKGDAYEGGHRMPFLVRWPGTVKPGSVSEEIVCHTDLMATVAEIVKMKLPKNAGGDSVSYLPALKGEVREQPLREALIITCSKKTFAVRQGPWKLITNNLGSGGFTPPRYVEPEKDGPQGQLYHLATDLSETKNLYMEHPEIVKKLEAILKRYQEQEDSVPRS
ncbi:Choline-sulfatase [Planctomycetales bacterium 10988]|nr:Choline-sulfatase [Planctomycetales bacterium 10988]